MNMSTYLDEIEYAAKSVITVIWAEQDALVGLRARIGHLTREMTANYGKVESLIADPDLDDDNISTGLYWETYFGVDKDRHYAMKDEQELNGDSGPKRTGFLGEGENRSWVKANTIPGPTRTKIPAGTRMVFVPPRNCFRDGPE